MPSIASKKRVSGTYQSNHNGYPWAAGYPTYHSMNDEDKLEVVLDGLIATVDYCEENGLDDLAERAAGLYQDVATASPEEHWGDVSEEDVQQFIETDDPAHEGN